jgi:hypothetical protein
MPLWCSNRHRGISLRAHGRSSGNTEDGIWHCKRRESCQSCAQWETTRSRESASSTPTLTKLDPSWPTTLASGRGYSPSRFTPAAVSPVTPCPPDRDTGRPLAASPAPSRPPRRISASARRRSSSMPRWKESRRRISRSRTRYSVTCSSARVGGEAGKPAAVPRRDSAIAAVSCAFASTAVVCTRQAALQRPRTVTSTRGMVPQQGDHRVIRLMSRGGDGLAAARAHRMPASWYGKVTPAGRAYTCW